MNSVESNMEQQIKDAGFSISDTMPGGDNPAQQEAQPQEAQPQPQAEQPPVEQQTAPEPSAPVADAEPAPAAQEVQQETAPVQESTPDPVQQEQSSFNEDLSALETFFGALGETQTETPQQVDSTESITATEIDPRIQVIADFVEKTGRSPEDWFRYQALDPSEMDDRTAMRVQMASEYPSLANDEIDLLINSKYKTDDSMYNEEEVRLANLQLKIDAEKARNSIGTLRNDYTSPVIETSNQAEEEPNPFDQSWLNANQKSLGELGEIAFDLPGGKSFNFGVPQDYRNELGKSNSDMTSYFDKYVGNEGQWDHDLWNMHRTVTDNLPQILNSIYAQGLSDGQRTIVEKAANIDPQQPQANPNMSQQDSLTQQVLDALGRPQMFLK
jgi:hypothetical protein